MLAAFPLIAAYVLLCGVGYEAARWAHRPQAQAAVARPALALRTIFSTAHNQQTGPNRMRELFPAQVGGAFIREVLSHAAHGPFFGRRSKP